MIWCFIRIQRRMLFLVDVAKRADSQLLRMTLRKEEIWWNVGVVAVGSVFHTNSSLNSGDDVFAESSVYLFQNAENVSPNGKIIPKLFTDEEM